MVTSKTCRDCGRTLPIADFYVKEERPTCTHYFSRCKVCYGKWVHGPRKRTRIVREKLTPDEQRQRKAARAAVNTAVWRGKLKKPDRCQKCDQPRPVEGHHHRGYQRKLDVEWLCGGCHREAHAA